MVISSLLFYDDVSLFYIYNYGYGKSLSLVVLRLLLYCSFNFMYSLFYEPAMTTTKIFLFCFCFFKFLNIVHICPSPPPFSCMKAPVQEKAGQEMGIKSNNSYIYVC